MGKKIDLTGQKFYNLTVLYECPERQNKQILWHCKCDCGTEIDVIGSNLRRGNTKSCGCRKSKPHENREDLSGKHFNFFTILKVDHIDNKYRTYYQCQCQCGNIKIVRSDHLKANKIISCGCYQKSKGEEKIKELLIQYNIPFEQQKTFIDCKDERPLPFDFYVNNQYIIEYDGIQHFEANGGWNTENNVLKVKKHDQIKDEYCKKNNIPIIRIPYTLYDSLNINHLLLNKTAEGI